MAAIPRRQPAARGPARGRDRGPRRGDPCLRASPRAPLRSRGVAARIGRLGQRRAGTAQVGTVGAVGDVLQTGADGASAVADTALRARQNTNAVTTTASASTAPNSVV